MEKIVMNELLIFAKYPEPAKVKSRLARTMGHEMAAQIYKTMVEKVVKATKPCDGEYQVTLYYDPPQKGSLFQSWLRLHHQKPQCSGDLGKKMHHALAQSLIQATCSVLIGTDCLDIDRRLILEALRYLQTADLVLGPAKDGGYYLIGFKRVYRELFTGIAWSSARVLSQTLKIAKELKLHVSLLPEMEDIDTENQYYGKPGEKIRSNLHIRDNRRQTSFRTKA